MLTHRLLALALVGTEWIIWALLFLSVVSLAIIIEKFMCLRRKRGNQEELKDLRLKIEWLLRKKDYKAIEGVLYNNRSSSAEVTLKTIKNAEESGVSFEDSLAIALSEEKLALESRIAILGTLGSNAPFIGLFGTVLGIIHAFHSLAMNAKGGPSTVMVGISEALVATALGLFVAIPAVAAYNYSVRYIKKIMVTAENFARLVGFAYIKVAAKKD
ncbi:MAG: MotA/TolQ/ExbB proton channel family protein [Candidatus Omnitrophica bacterium]|nr:MotA/TolQ/ExbB proton channel family protein [Candidatus Omnitrophota bacterium]MDD5611200.1 MotA/TolQ/ExbB proton channel family protein [Candidatus Omnitrophota bacterium]